MMATYGEGEPTDNAKELYGWVAKEAKEDAKPLAGMRFGVFGLGNKTYEHYNAVGRLFDARLEALGGTRMVPYGEGDDDASLEDDFSSWKRAIMAPLCAALGVEQKASAFDTGALGPTWKWTVTWDVAPVAEADKPKLRFTGMRDAKKGAYDQHHPFLTRIVTSRELNGAGATRGCIHADLALPAGVRYEEGDHLGVYPLNPPELVRAYTDYFGYDAARTLIITGNTDKDRGRKLHGPLTVAHAFALLPDLQEVPRKSVLEKLLPYAGPEDAPMHVALRQFVDKQVYHDRVEKGYMTVLEVLQALPQRLAVPCEELLQILPHLQPRYYSISSSLAATPGLASITCARVDEVSPTGRVHKGIASHWLYSLMARPDPAVPVAAFVRTSTFRMPTQNRPALMIGPGTGIAPFMGFLQRRIKGGERRGDVLFTGFRHRATEYLYGETLEQWARDGFVELHVAFSRDADTKHYVQHDLEREGARVWHLIDQLKATVYICGDANHMEKDVVNTLRRIFATHGGAKDEAAAQAYLDALTAAKRFQKDTWF